MPTTVSASFDELSKRLNISDRQETIVSNCRKNVIAKIENKISLHTEQSSKLIGSYDRDTLIRYLSEGDVDLMIILHYGKNKDWDTNEGTAKVLARFKDILKEAYPNTDCSIDRNCVTMKLSEFRLDVVPAFRMTDESYKIPDTYRSKWLATDPVKFADEITRINTNMNGIFVPLVKMLKAWNRNSSKRLRGFHLECMLVRHYKGYTQDYSYASTLSAFFSNLPTYISEPSYDPIKGDRVDLYLDNKSLNYDREDFIKRAKQAASLAKEAYEDSKDYPALAMGNWKKLLGEFFPTYG